MSSIQSIQIVPSIFGYFANKHSGYSMIYYKYNKGKSLSGANNSNISVCYSIKIVSIIITVPNILAISINDE